MDSSFIEYVRQGKDLNLLLHDFSYLFKIKTNVKLVDSSVWSTRSHTQYITPKRFVFQETENSMKKRGELKF